MKQTLIEKFTSRKFLTTLAAELSGIITMILGANNPVAVIIGGIITSAATIVYCLVEGKLDSNSLKDLTNTITDVIDKLDTQ